MPVRSDKPCEGEARDVELEDSWDALDASVAQSTYTILIGGDLNAEPQSAIEARGGTRLKNGDRRMRNLLEEHELTALLRLGATYRTGSCIDNWITETSLSNIFGGASILEGLHGDDHNMVYVPMYYGTGEPGMREDRPTWSVTKGWDEDEGSAWGRYSLGALEAIQEAVDALRNRPDKPSEALRLFQNGLMRLARMINDQRATEKTDARDKASRSSIERMEAPMDGPERIAPKDKRERLRWGTAKWKRLRQAAGRWSGKRGNKKWEKRGLWKQPVIRDDKDLEALPEANEKKWMRKRRERMVQICDMQVEEHRQKLRAMGLPKGDQILQRMEEAAQAHAGTCMIETFNII